MSCVTSFRRLQELLVPDVALGVAHDDDDAVRAEQAVLVFEERRDVFVTGRAGPCRSPHPCCSFVAS